MMGCWVRCGCQCGHLQVEDNPTARVVVFPTSHTSLSRVSLSFRARVIPTLSYIPAYLLRLLRLPILLSGFSRSLILI